MKYLFKCLFNNGEKLEQTQEDKSQTTENKNAFYDVLQRLNEVRAFALYSQETKQEYLVDISDGHFEVNSGKFFLHNEYLTNLRLIFFKRNTIDMSTGRPYPQQYILGFQGNDINGNNKQYTITLV